MTETIEQKALALVNEVAKEMDLMKVKSLDTNLLGVRALCRAIEQHEAFRWEVSIEAVEYKAHGSPMAWTGFDRFIIPKPQPDPLHECLEEALARTGEDLTEHIERLHAALAARGLEIVKKEPSQ